MRGLLPPLLALCASACAPPVRTGGFDAPDPASRLYAIERAARERDMDAIPRLVESLDHDDPAVRLAAIEALRLLTGETRGYDCSADPMERRAAIARWGG